MLLFSRYLNWLQRGWHNILPSCCLWCSLPVESHLQQLCSACQQALPQLDYSLCHYNLLWLPQIRRGLPKNIAFEQLLSLAVYQQPYQHWLQRWKFNQDLAAGELLQQQFGLLLQHYQQYQSRLPEAITYVPMHPRHQRQRGFNPALQLAQQAAKQLQLPLLPLLQRHSMQHQVGLTRQQRQRNLKHAFSATTPHSTLPEHIALVDDVITTGATANMLCNLLKKQGARQISLWTLAVTPASDNINC